MQKSQKVRIFALIAAGVLAYGTAGCGASAKAAPSYSSTSGCAVGVLLDTTAKPLITIPSCAKKPSSLQAKDVVAGKGVAAKAGDAVTVRYIGYAWDTKKEFDASWDNGLGTYKVSPLGQAPVIDGWNQGLIGAKAGARRLLVIPPSLGYGAPGYAPAIAPNETLIFVIDVVSVTPAGTKS